VAGAATWSSLGRVLLLWVVALVCGKVLYMEFNRRWHLMAASLCGAASGLVKGVGLCLCLMWAAGTLLWAM